MRMSHGKIKSQTPSSKSAHLSATTSLSALETFRNSGLFLPQITEQVPAKCIWINTDHQTNSNKNRQRLGLQFARVVTNDSQKFIEFPATDPSRDGCGFADLYISVGSTQIGSGRSVFWKGHQIKGCGRTGLAQPIGYRDNVNGILAARTAFDEIIHTKWLDLLLSRSAMSTEALLFTQPKKRLKQLLAIRRGSPIRLGHLFMIGALAERYTTRIDRRTTFAFFFNNLYGLRSTNLSYSCFKKRAQDILKAALTEMAECRLFGIRLTNWADNYDLFSRNFDNEEVHFCFQHRYKKSIPPGLTLPQKSDARTWFSDLFINHNSPFLMRSLYSLAGAIKAVEFFSEELNCPMALTRSIVNWKSLSSEYELALSETLNRALNINDSDLLNKIRCIAGRSLDLIPTDIHLCFRTDLFLDFVVNMNNHDFKKEYKKHSKEWSAALVVNKYLGANSSAKGMVLSHIERILPLLKYGDLYKTIQATSEKMDHLQPNEVEKELPKAIDSTLQLLAQHQPHFGAIK